MKIKLELPYFRQENAKKFTHAILYHACTQTRDESARLVLEAGLIERLVFFKEKSLYKRSLVPVAGFSFLIVIM